MKIDNRTHWSTRDLRRILTRVAMEELSDTRQQQHQRRHLHVTIVYSRRVGRHSGCAWLKGTSARLCIPKAGVNPVEFAWLAAHEFSHTRGQEHAQMTGDVLYFTAKAQATYAWAAAFPIRRVVPKRSPRPGDEQKHQHAVTMLARATTRRKRAATLERKWQKRVRYYATKMAAGGRDETHLG